MPAEVIASATADPSPPITEWSSTVMIFVVDAAFQQVGDCFLTSVRMVGEACAGRDAEVVEHEEGC